MCNYPAYTDMPGSCHLCSLGATGLQLNDFVTAQFQGAKEDFNALGEKLTAKFDDVASTKR